MIKYINKLPKKGLIFIPCFEDKDIILPSLLKDGINTWISSEKWKAGKSKKLELTLDNYRVILFGLGKNKEFCDLKFAEIVGDFSRSNSKFIFFSENINLDAVISRRVIESLILSQYKFDKYFTAKKDKKEEPVFQLLGFNEYKDEMEEGRILAEANIITRKLINEPANVIYPETLANKVLEIGESHGFDVEVMDEDKIIELKMESYLSVARAAEKRPKLIVMRYFGNPENKNEILGLVGKGLTYDTGGLSLKPTSGMVGMKSDMGGSAAVIGAMSAISRMKIKRNVIAVVAACENSIGGNAYRPGDIISSMAGKTIEIGNTDAEGRLTLIDAVHYVINKENATKVVDIATLTGAVLVALGTERAGVLSNNDKFYNKLEKASLLSGEKIWRLPHDDEYLELIKSKVADLNNSGGRFAGTVTAGLFIREFVGKTPWIHIDIAGTSMTEKVKGEKSSGGTGSGSRLLYFLAKEM